MILILTYPIILPDLVLTPGLRRPGRPANPVEILYMNSLPFVALVCLMPRYFDALCHHLRFTGRSFPRAVFNYFVWESSGQCWGFVRFLCFLILMISVRICWDLDCSFVFFVFPKTKMRHILVLLLPSRPEVRPCDQLRVDSIPLPVYTWQIWIGKGHGGRLLPVLASPAFFGLFFTAVKKDGDL